VQAVRCPDNARDQSQLGILGRLTALVEKGRRCLAPHSITSSEDVSSSRAFHHLENHRRELSGASLNAVVEHTLAESVAGHVPAYFSVSFRRAHAPAGPNSDWVRCSLHSHRIRKTDNTNKQVKSEQRGQISRMRAIRE
jgi:hypothetical protein